MADHADNTTEMVDLRALLAVLRRHKLLVATTTILMTVLAVGLIARRTPLYSATSEIEVRPLTAQTAQYGSFYDLQSAMDTEAARMMSQPVADRAAKLGAPEDSSVSATVPTNTTYIDVTCTTPVPADSLACAQAYAEAYIVDRRQTAKKTYLDATAGFDEAIEAAGQEIDSLNAQLDAATTHAMRQQFRGQIDDVLRQQATAQLQLMNVPTPSGSPALPSYDATLPTAPSNKGYVSTAILALVVGLAFGIGLAFLRDRLDERIGGRAELEHGLGVPVIAQVPRTPGGRRPEEALVSLTAPNGAASEAYRTARTTLLYLAKEGGIRVVAVTGPGQGEGKTTTTSNLAVTLAQSGKRVVVISGDLRRPTLHKYFHLDMNEGLSNVLSGTVDLPQTLRKTDVPGLLVMPSGPVPTNPAELLASPAMDRVIEELRRVADFVLVDTPPALIVSDVLGLAPKVDGVMVVVDATSTPRSALSHLRAQIDRVGGNLIGSILNNLDRKGSKYYDTYGDYSMDGERYRAADIETVHVAENAEVTVANGHSANGNGAANGTGNGHGAISHGGRRAARRAGKHTSA